jgi:hypothetical protein
MADTYETWLKEVEEALSSINMPMDDWQKIWAFDFQHEFNAGTTANNAAMKANRSWWQHQNKAIGQDCRKTQGCWLPRDHRGECEPCSDARTKMGKYRTGDHVKIEVKNEHSGESEWMWLLVERSDDSERIVFGKLDSEPIAVTDMRLGQELAVSYDNIRDHRRFD